MANPLIQQAVSLEIDHTGIVNSVLSGVGSVLAGTIYPAAKRPKSRPFIIPPVQKIC
jgi:ABC-type transport system substrate-binding protein